VAASCSGTPDRRPGEGPLATEDASLGGAGGSGVGGSGVGGRDAGEAPRQPDAGDAEPADPYLVFEPISLDVAPSQMTSLRFIPGRSEFLVTTRTGEVHHYGFEGNQATHLGSFQAPGVYAHLDCGLIALAFDPDFADSGLLYLSQCFSVTHSGIQRLRFDESDYAGIPDTAVSIVQYGDADATLPWHNFGQLGFEPDGTLWALVGEKTIFSHAADPATPLGTMIRIVPSRLSGEGGYTPAAGNAAETLPGFHPDVYAYGLRSPWTGARLGDGRWLIADVGQQAVEEVNLVSAPGQNFGWPAYEGACTGQSCPSDLTNPIVQWSHASDHPFVQEDPYATAAITRVGWVGPEYVPPRDDLDRYEGHLTHRVLFGDMCFGYVRMLGVDDSQGVTLNVHVGHLAGASSWDVGPDGYLYAASFGRCTTSWTDLYPSGRIFRAVLSDTPPGFVAPRGDFPEKLSDFGIFPEAPDLTVVASRATPFSPRWELWSNGLHKERHAIIPDGLERQGDDYDFPNGTSFFKTFSADSGLVETRVMQLHEGAWHFAAYQWNEAGTDATLLDGALPVSVMVTVGSETFEHSIPSRAQCLACHEVGARRVLGYTPLQRGDDAELPTQAGGEELDELTASVMGYAYANCTHCHDGSGGPQASFSLLPEVFLENTVNHPTQSSASGAGIRVVPGAPGESILYLALVGAEGVAPMPPLGVERRDLNAIDRVHQWISSLAEPAPEPLDAGSAGD
jgi:hypothetical protein